MQNQSSNDLAPLRILHFAFFILHFEGPRSSVRSERHRAKVEVAGAIPAVDAILPLCLSSHRTSFVNL